MLQYHVIPLNSFLCLSCFVTFISLKHYPIIDIPCFQFFPILSNSLNIGKNYFINGLTASSNFSLLT